MRNIHTIDRPTLEIFGVMPYGKSETQYQIECFLASRNVYITSNEIPKKGDYMLYGASSIVKCEIDIDTTTEHFKMYGMGAREKIIMTTDPKLIKDGIQAIPNEFMEWLVKNPSCEEVETIYEPKNYLDTKQGWEYVIIIPKEESMFINDEDLERASLEDFIDESKQERLEEIAKTKHRELSTAPIGIIPNFVDGFLEGFKEAEKTMYSEEDFKLFARQYFREIKMDKSNLLWETLADKCLEQFKNK